MGVLNLLSSTAAFVIIYIVTVHQPSASAQEVGGARCSIVDLISCWMPCMPCKHRPNATCRRVRRGCRCENTWIENNLQVACTPVVSAVEAANNPIIRITGGRVVTTTQRVQSQPGRAGPACPNGVRRVQCTVDPCDVASCPSAPTAVCRPSYCGGCFAEFYHDGLRVCQVSHPVNQINEANMVDGAPLSPDRGPLDNTLRDRQAARAVHTPATQGTTTGSVLINVDAVTSGQPVRPSPLSPERRSNQQFDSPASATQQRPPHAGRTGTPTPQSEQVPPPRAPLPPTTTSTRSPSMFFPRAGQRQQPPPQAHVPVTTTSTRPPSLFSPRAGQRQQDPPAGPVAPTTNPTRPPSRFFPGAGQRQQPPPQANVPVTTTSTRPPSRFFPRAGQRQQDPPAGPVAPTTNPTRPPSRFFPRAGQRQQPPPQANAPVTSTSTCSPSRFFPGARQQQSGGSGLPSANVGTSENLGNAGNLGNSGTSNQSQGTTPGVSPNAQAGTVTSTLAAPVTTTTTGRRPNRFFQSGLASRSSQNEGRITHDSPAAGIFRLTTSTTAIPTRHTGPGGLLARGSNVPDLFGVDIENSLPSSPIGPPETTTLPPTTTSTTTTAAPFIENGTFSTASAAPCSSNARRAVCLEDPCLGQTCDVASAKCRPSGCGSCHAEWYVGERVVTCRQDCASLRLVNAWCPMNPCVMQTCDQFPNAVCRATTCGSCRAEWYQGQERVTTRCFSDVSIDGCPTHQPPSCKCRRCPSSPSAKCRIRGCGNTCRLEFVARVGGRERVIPCHGLWQRL